VVMHVPLACRLNKEQKRPRPGFFKISILIDLYL
jgi:hypothetical protein